MRFRIRKPYQPADPPAAATDPDVRAVQPADVPPASPAFQAMKRQLSSSDVRTDRLVRQLRDEIDGMRSLLDDFAEGQEELLAADPAAIAANPEAAATLPPALLVRTILAVEAERAAEARRAGDLEREAVGLRAEVQQLRLSEAGLQGRLSTFEDVIAALHDNIQDLRYARDRAAIDQEAPRPRLKAVHDADDLPGDARAAVR